MASRIRYTRLATERANPRSRALDLLSPREIAALMNREDRRAVLAVGRVRSAIASAVRMIVGALRGGGRLFFVGAGTSGRLGVLEAAECPPTFGAAPRLDPAQGRHRDQARPEYPDDGEHDRARPNLRKSHGRSRAKVGETTGARVEVDRRAGGSVEGARASGVRGFGRSSACRDRDRWKWMGCCRIHPRPASRGRVATRRASEVPAEVAGAYPNRLELQGEEHPRSEEHTAEIQSPC